MRFVVFFILFFYKYFVIEMMLLVWMCLLIKYNMVDKDGGCVDEGCESKV